MNPCEDANWFKIVENMRIIMSICRLHFFFFFFRGALRPQKLYGLLGTVKYGCPFNIYTAVYLFPFRGFWLQTELPHGAARLVHSLPMKPHENPSCVYFRYHTYRVTESARERRIALYNCDHHYHHRHR